jgi:hypothetical protein
VHPADIAHHCLFEMLKAGYLYTQTKNLSESDISVGDRERQGQKNRGSFACDLPRLTPC